MAMSPWQALKQFRHVLETVTWDDSPNDLVFGANSTVIITAGLPPDPDATALGMGQVALLGVDTAEGDPDDPDLYEEVFKLAVAVQVMGDSFGTASLVGANRGVDGADWQSQGRGLLEFEEVVLGAIGRVTGADGCPVVASLTNAAPPAPIGDGLHVVAREYDIRGWVTRQRGYPAPYDLVAADNGDGTVTLTWKIPPGDRFDYRDLVLRHIAGTTAPATASAGADVDLGVATAAKALLTVDHTPGSDGSHSYALFAGYTDTGVATNERFSEQETGTTRTVSVTGS